LRSEAELFQELEKKLPTPQRKQVTRTESEASGKKKKWVPLSDMGAIGIKISQAIPALMPNDLVMLFNSVTPQGVSMHKCHKGDVIDLKYAELGRKKVIAQLDIIFQVRSAAVVDAGPYLMYSPLPFRYSTRRCPYRGRRVIVNDPNAAKLWHVVPVQALLQKLRVVPLFDRDFPFTFVIDEKIKHTRYLATTAPRTTERELVQPALPPRNTAVRRSERGQQPSYIQRLSWETSFPEDEWFVHDN